MKSPKAASDIMAVMSIVMVTSSPLKLQVVFHIKFCILQSESWIKIQTLRIITHLLCRDKHTLALCEPKITNVANNPVKNESLSEQIT